MKRLFSREAALVAALILVPAAARAYPLYWIGTQVRGNSVSWQYSGNGSDGKPWSSSRAPADQVHAAIGATFVAFAPDHAKDAAANSCSYLSFTDTTPATGTTDRLEQEGRWTEGVFVSERTDPIYQYMRGGVVAFALPSPDDDGYVFDCDTVYNAVDVPFSTGSGGNSLSLQGVAMQETAHCFGLHHVCQQSPGDGQPPCDGADVDTASVMFPFADPGFGADEPDGRDLDNMCQIYPVNGIGRPCDGAYSGPDGQPLGFAVPDCLQGTTCTCTEVGQICTKACSATTDCPAGARCASGSCVPDFYPGTEHTGVATRTGFGCDTGNVLHKAIGTACTADADCGQGESCLQGPAGGYCSVDCSNANCPPDGECITDVLKAGDAWCLKPCTFNVTSCEPTGCREGHVCQAIGNGTHGVCFDGCRSDADCDSATPPQAVCDTSTGMCHPKRTSPVCGPHAQDPVPPACVATCTGVACGESDSCGGFCDEGSGCVTRPDGGTPSTPAAPKGCGCGAFDVSALALAGLFFRRKRAGKAFAAGLLVVGLAFLAACAPPDPVQTPDGGSGGPPAVTKENFRDQLAEAYCDYGKRCAPALEHVYCDLSGSPFTPEITSGRVGFDPAIAATCVENVRESPCAPDAFLGTALQAASTCDAATPPALDDGASCFDDRDCKGGFCDSSATCPGKCAKVAAVGESCAKAKCASDSYCSRRSGKCVALGANGASCFFGQQCASGNCKVDLRLQRAVCADPKGANGQKAGANCTSYDDCADGLYCHFDPTTLDGQQYPSGKCRAQIAPGYTCGLDGDFQGVVNACAKGLACVGYSLPPSPSLHDPQLPGACLPWADVGEACIPARSGAGAAVTGCLYGLVCGADGKCALPKPGNPCGIDPYSGCVRGETCDSQQGKCVPYGSEGDQCFLDDQCQSRSCIGGRCSPVCHAQ